MRRTVVNLMLKLLVKSAGQCLGYCDLKRPVLRHFHRIVKNYEAELLTRKIFILIFIYFFILFQGCIGVVSKLFVGGADDASSPCCSIPSLPPKMVVIVDFRVNDVSCHTYCIHF